MNKFIIIFLYALILTVSLQYFFPQKNTSQNQQNILLAIVDDELVIPNIPKISVNNGTATGFTLSPCKDLSLTINSQVLTDIGTAYPEFCSEMVIPPNASASISFDPLSKIFATQPGNYVLSMNSPLGNRILSFSTSEPGAIRSLLTTVVYDPIYNLFVAILTFLPGHSLGWAILIITIIIRLILLIPQHQMLQSQKKLQILQPKIKDLQTRYKDDQAKLGMEMLELYKKEGVNPLGSCLPLLIQMPILIGLYWVISSITDVSNFYHLYPFFEEFNPKNIDPHFFGIELLQIGGIAAIVFGIALAIIQYIQARLSFAYQGPLPKKEEKKKSDEENGPPELALDPEMMKKMMLYFLPLIIGISAYFFPLGVGLYWFIGTLFVIAQQWYVNKGSSK